MLWKLIKWLFKLAWKLFLIALFAILSLVETFLVHFNKWLKEQI